MPEPTSENALKEKEVEIEKLKAEKEKADGRVENAERKFQDWGNQIGEIRKEKDELKEALTKTKETLEEAQSVITSLKNVEKPAPASGAENNNSKKEEEESPDTIEKSLSEKQRKAGEEGFNTLSDAEKLQYDDDPKFRLSFLKRLKENAPVIPDSPWKTANKKKTEEEKSGYENILDRIFKKKKQVFYVPSGSLSGAPVFGSTNPTEKNEPPEDSRVH